LDVGAGQGYFSCRLKELDFQVDACDFIADNFKCPDIFFKNADLNGQLPYEDNQFDCVVSIEVIEHMENHFKFMSEMMRVTKPNGVVIITTPNVLSLPSRWYLFLYGYTDCAPIPLDPEKKEHFMDHINPISLPELLFHVERFGVDLVDLTTNRIRRSSFIPMLLFYPLIALAIRYKLLRRKHKSALALHRRHIRWMLTPANLMGRITIAMARKRTPLTVSRQPDTH
jgi:SAM-dependent methyltransferase